MLLNFLLVLFLSGAAVGILIAGICLAMHLTDCDNPNNHLSQEADEALNNY